jgi:hypothetical protein
MNPKSLLLGMLGGAALIALLLLVFGVRFTADVMGYDPSREVNTVGTIVSTEDFACPATQGELGEHVMLKTAEGEYEVHLAPARIMRSLKWNFEPGQQVQVIGSKVVFHGKPGLLARRIMRGDELFTIRDSHGMLLVKQP